MGFLDLPAELRNDIYDQVLKSSSIIEVRHRHLYEVHFGYYRALTQVSKRVRSDCLPIYYAGNTFMLRSMSDCLAWLNIIGKDCRYLRELRLADDVLEGCAWSAERKSTSHHRVKVSIRLSTSAGSEAAHSELITEDLVDDEMRTKAEDRLKAIEDATKDFGNLDLKVSGTIHHCKHCASSVCRWCRFSTCCKKLEQDSDSD